MDDILSIGRSKRPNAVLRRAGAQRAGLVQEVIDAGDDESDALQGAEDTYYASSPSPAAPTPAGPRCAVCRIRSSPYTCPQCNIPYCSLTCFRAEKHASCSSKFAQQMMRSGQEDVGDDADRGTSGSKAPRADETERQKMLDVLRRMQSMGELGGEDDEEGGDAEQEEPDSGAAAGVHAKALRAGVDLKNASTNELLALLSVDERTQFEAMVRGDSKAGGKGDLASSKALTKLLSQSQSKDEDETFWWRKGVATGDDEDSNETPKPTAGKHFTHAVDKIRQSVNKDNVPAKLEWNVVAVLLAYVYVVRHLDVHNLQEAHADEQVVARGLFARLIPYLVTSEYLGDDDRSESIEDVSRTLLSSAEEATVWIVARLGSDVGKEPASTMRFLYDEALWIINRETSGVVIVGEDNVDACEQRLELRLFSDVNSVLASKATRRKLAFYAAYWACLVETKDSRDAVIAAMQAEAQRLDAEMKRSEDEERWRAAHELVQQSGSVVLPPARS